MAKKQTPNEFIEAQEFSGEEIGLPNLPAEEPQPEEPQPEEPNASSAPSNTEYQLVDPRIANVAHGDVIYPVANGKIACSRETAQELIAAGVLKS